MLPSCFHKVLAMSAYEVAYEQNGRKASHSISLTASIASDAVGMYPSEFENYFILIICISVERPVSLCNGTLYSFDNLLKCEGTVP